MVENRQKWGVKDWAMHFNCTVQCIQQYKKLLKQHFLPCVEQDIEDRQYYFTLYKRDVMPSGNVKMTVLMTGENGFRSHKDAIEEARRDIMPLIKLDPRWAKAQNIPVNAIQIMRIRIK